MKLVSILSFYLLSTFSTLYGKGDNKIITHSFDRAEQQYTAMLKALPEPTAYPRTTDNNGKLRTTPLNDCNPLDRSLGAAKETERTP